MNETNEYKYSSFDLMKEFSIQKGSWYNIKTKYKLDRFSIKVLEGKITKFLYSEDAFKILEKERNKKMQADLEKTMTPQNRFLIQQNYILKNQLQKYEDILKSYENRFTALEEQREEDISKIEKLSEFKAKFENLEEQKNKIENINKKISKMNFLDRIFRFNKKLNEFYNEE